MAFVPGPAPSPAPGQFILPSTSWIGSFVEWSEQLASPIILRTWCGVAAVSGALERRCWTTTFAPLYPNVYVILVAAPGVGKTLPISAVLRLWRKQSELNVGSDTITKAGTIDELKESFRSVTIPPNDFMMFHSLLIGSEELTNLIPSYDLEFLGILGKIYDCGDRVQERTRKLGRIDVDSPHMTILGATQPKFLSSLFPDAAYGQGFASRLILVYSNQRVSGNLWPDQSARDALKEKEKFLSRGLGRIVSMVGEFTWAPAAKRLLAKWEDEGYPPVPTYHRLEHYCQRRRTHILKLSMVFSAAESSALIVTEDHVRLAMGLLFDTEDLMPEIFREMSQASTPTVVQDCLHWMLRSYAATKKPIAEPRIWNYLTPRMASHQIRGTVDAMVQAQLISAVPSRRKDVRMFIPREINLDEE